MATRNMELGVILVHWKTNFPGILRTSVTVILIENILSDDWFCEKYYCLASMILWYITIENYWNCACVYFAFGIPATANIWWKEAAPRHICLLILWKYIDLNIYWFEKLLKMLLLLRFYFNTMVTTASCMLQRGHFICVCIYKFW